MASSKQRVSSSYRDPFIAADTSVETSESDLSQSLSRRELLILRMLTEGASNKVIALRLVIAEFNGEGAHEGHFEEASSAEPYAGRNVGAQLYQ